MKGRTPLFRLPPLLAFFCLAPATVHANPVRPNLLVIVADGIEVEKVDEKTFPNLHRLRESSDRFVDFHVHPVPAMRRARLLTGRPAMLSGVVGEQAGRNLLPAREFTLAEAALETGYRTAFFSSWGLGDFAPFRPEDQGFLKVLTHGGSHIGSFADAWGNRGIDDILRRDGNQERFIGHSNDVWFDALLADLQNDPETPALWWIAPDFSAPVSEEGDGHDPKRRWLDRRLGEVLDRLEGAGRHDTTLVALIAKPPVALDRSPIFEEGHRASLWLRYPAREVGHGREIDGLSADIDLVPILAQLSPLPLHRGPPVHGEDLTHRLRIKPIEDHLADRSIVFATIRDSSIPSWQDVCVMRGSMRRIHLKDERGASTEEELFLSSTSRGSLRSLRDYREFTVRLRYRLGKGSAGFGFRLPLGQESVFDGTAPGLVPLAGEDPEQWHRFELTVRGGRAVAFRDGMEVARIESLPSEIGTLEFLLDTAAEPTSLSLRDLEFIEYGEMERLTSWVREAGVEKGFHGDFVRISLPYSKELPDGNHEPLFHYGFLQEEASDRGKARIFNLDGFESEVVAQAPGREPMRNPGVSWQAASLEDHGRRWQEADWSTSRHKRLDQPPVGSSMILDAPSYAIVLAAALREQGETELARALFEKAWRALVKEPRDRSFDSLRTHLAKSLASVRFAAAVQENGRPEVPRSVVSGLLDALIERFPATEATNKARSMREALQATCEFRGESFLDEEALAELSPEARVEEWIRQLETQRGGQFMSKGFCDPFFDPRGAESPAARLAEMGRTAIPRLIEAMDDTRPTRSPARDGYTLRVGEVAIKVIERIATKSFSPFPETMAFGGHEAAKAEVLAWWDSVKDIDSVAERTLAIRSGGREVRHHAASLYEEIGHEALPVIIEAARAATNPGLRGELVTIAARGGLERSGDFLREEMRNGPGIGSRVRAAAALDRLGDDKEALDLMIAAWRERRDAGFPNDPEERGPLGHASMFLLGHPAPEALAALTEGWTELPLGIRSRILSTWRDDWPTNVGLNELLSLPTTKAAGVQLPGIFGAYGYPGSYRTGTLQPDGSVNSGGFTIIPTARSLPPANREILEEALYASLEETRRRFDDNALGGSHGRLCDDAAKILTTLHPDRLVFAADGSWRQREMDRLTLLNHWLEQSGKPGKALPPIPDTPPGTKADILASMSVEIPANAPAELRDLLVSAEKWKGATPDLDTLLDFSRRAVTTLPGGWELLLRLDGDPELFRGLHLGIEISPFDLEIHRRDVGTLEPDAIWFFFRTEAGGGIKTHSRQNRFHPKEPLVFDPESGKLENFEAFEGALHDLTEPLALTLRQAETHAIFFEMAVRRAPDGR